MLGYSRMTDSSCGQSGRPEQALSVISPDAPAVAVTRFGSGLAVPLCAGGKAAKKKALHLVGAGQTPQQRIELVALVPVERLEERVNLLFGLDDLLNPDVQNVVLLIFFVTTSDRQQPRYRPPYIPAMTSASSSGEAFTQSASSFFVSS